MKIAGFLLGLILAYTGAMLALTGDVRPAVAAPAQHVILLHGWSGNGNGWSDSRAAYEAAGLTVHTPSLPYSGWQAGDTRRNADYIEALIAQGGLTNVQVDGHSLGGTLVYELVRVRRNPAIVSAVTRDSSIQNAGGDTGISCWAVPDQCEGSAQRNAIQAAPLAAVPVLNLTRTTDTTGQPDVDCYRHYNIAHNAFAADPAVIADAVAWAQGGNPCTPTTPAATTPSPTPTPSPSPTPSPTNTPAPTTTAPTSTPTATATTTQASSSPTSSPSPTSTSAPAMTPTPRPASCSWWARLLGWC